MTVNRVAVALTRATVTANRVAVAVTRAAVTECVWEQRVRAQLLADCSLM